MEVKLLVDKINTPKAREAARIYYEHFGTDKPVTVNEAAGMAGTDGAEVHIYLAHTEGTGMPETREEAMKYLEVLESCAKPGD
jgi:hypothetical protein